MPVYLCENMLRAVSPDDSGYPMRKLGNRVGKRGGLFTICRRNGCLGCLKGYAGYPTLPRISYLKIVNVRHPGNSTRRLKHSSYLTHP